jgi:hypothetical protein
LRSIPAAALILLLALAASGETRAPCDHRDPLRRPFFGDLHVHTTFSLDASTQGTRTRPAEAYRFARGEAIGLHPFTRDGTPLRQARLARPLDFAAVTDHAELLGETAICNTPGLPGHDAFACRVYRGWPRLAFFLMNGRGSPRFAFCGENAEHCLAAARGPWSEIQAAAEAAYDRTPSCAFTSFHALEWTKSGSRTENLHRNVIFRSEHVPVEPPNAIDQPSKEALWDALDRDCRPEAGCDVVVIPHNSNLSGGLMFSLESRAGEPLTAEEAARRAQREPLVEIVQHKGASECSRTSAPADELCGFEELPYDRFMGRFLPVGQETPSPLNYVRHALAAGLAERVRIGVNPFEFGLIGSTDTHLGTPGLVGETADFPGHGGAGIPIGDEIPDGLIDVVEYNPGGLAVVWAEENTRDSLFAALLRRETYATSGPRILLRTFAGWEMPEGLCEAGDLIAQGYARGVPMGGELGPAPAGAAPRLAVWAQRDAGTPDEPGVSLQRLQIVKAWTEGSEPREAVFDIAGDPANEADIDPESCTPRGSGAEQLCRVWTDPDFDPAAPALYYARAVENPTCRWHAHACLAAGVDCADPSTVRTGFEACCDPAWPRTVQERAWGSPIWYTPE